MGFWGKCRPQIEVKTRKKTFEIITPDPDPDKFKLGNAVLKLLLEFVAVGDSKFCWQNGPKIKVWTRYFCKNFLNPDRNLTFLSLIAIIYKLVNPCKMHF